MTETQTGWDAGALLSGLAGLLFGIWLGLHPMVQLLVVLIFLDIGTGLLSAFVRKELSSSISFRGMAKKAIELMLVAAAQWLDRSLGVDLPIAEAVAGFYAAHELLSILENAALAGLPVPSALRGALSRLSTEDPRPPSAAAGGA